MARSYSMKKYTYLLPNPFTAPNNGYQNYWIPPLTVRFPRDTLFFSAAILEDIMYNLDCERDRRGESKFTWYVYYSGLDETKKEKKQFHPQARGATNTLAKSPIEFFWQYVKDIQVAIDTLIADSRWPDTRGAYLARTFGAGVCTPGFGGGWTHINRLSDNVQFFNKNGAQIKPLSNVVGGSWPFDPNSDSFKQSFTRMGIPITGGTMQNGAIDGSTKSHIRDVTARVKADVAKGQDGLGQGIVDESDKHDVDWPECQIGKLRTQQDVDWQEGRLVTKKGKSVTGYDGVQLPMKPEGRPVSRRGYNQTIGWGIQVRTYAPDAGYGYLGMHPLAIQQLRYQHPIVERFDGPQYLPLNNYTSNLWSRYTVNINYVLSQPVERLVTMNWGNWLCKGYMSNDGGGLNIGIIGDQFAGQIIVNCPYALWYPPPESYCSAAYGDGSYAIWGCNVDHPLRWSDITIWQGGGYSSDPKYCGPKTRMGMNYSYSPSSPTFGGFDATAYTYSFYVAVRVSAYGDNNNQPFIPLLVAPNSRRDRPFNYGGDWSKDTISVMKSFCQSTGRHDKFGFSINVIDALNHLRQVQNWGGKPLTATMVLAIAIVSEISAAGKKTCPAEAYRIVYGPGAIDAGLRVSRSCMASMSAAPGGAGGHVSHLCFYEDPLTGENDPRILQPPAPKT